MTPAEREAFKKFLKQPGDWFPGGRRSLFAAAEDGFAAGIAYERKRAAEFRSAAWKVYEGFSTEVFLKNMHPSWRTRVEPYLVALSKISGPEYEETPPNEEEEPNV